MRDTWYEYVPDSYDPSRKTPLVFSMHGGIMNGWGQCIYTSWSPCGRPGRVIVVYPNAHLRGFWQIECERRFFKQLSEPNDEGIYMHDFPDDIRENNDIRIVVKLTEMMKEKYNIDEERIICRACLSAIHDGHDRKALRMHFAGMAGSAGPSTIGLLFDKDDQPINAGGPVPVWQARMEFDQAPPASEEGVEDVVAKNREYWLRINECDTLSGAEDRRGE